MNARNEVKEIQAHYHKTISNTQQPLNPVQVPATAFVTDIQQPGSKYFAPSFRDMGIMLDDSLERLSSLRIGNASMVIPKDANPKEFLPPQYHDFLDVFDRKQANALPPHRTWDHAIDL
ncbi:hypothetical protein K3495_g3313 [Podosphaera aphanis]|nr:hypothetical protein K3495_g3313 [Podosphaera aphanis]